MGFNHQSQKKINSVIGRFAPSPTGPLHFGSLVAAVASYLAAKTQNNGKWFLRIEDVDTQREQPGASQSIIQTLESFGFAWDGDILFQSEQTERYQTALERISDHIYPCSCTRKYLQSLSDISTYGYLYPGICRNGINNPDIQNPSIRVKTNKQEICFQDLCQPHVIGQSIEQEIGDFILKRRDGLFAYQLAVVVDDAFQEINQVVRGSDILDNTPRQIFLQQLLGYPQLEYLHFPTAVTADGKKLSKQNHSPPVLTDNDSSDKKMESLLASLEFLGQNPPKRSNLESINDLWKWAFQHWDNDKIPKVMTKPTKFT
ncbi:tRNA glutamyl-Q(34) synthetase GluQRS [Cocleimonas flava]|uniref:Glutamyl-Q tRNA(Asp) synthetase n=1 Tax=Cocleimonas flava TaxID=634765 RepID=A0A4R1F307_9GAMM|nr:tRNA glutamyl-Q(34) synthetase GluQRS [Cocleimonas flava]TCJ86779.1 glutamyl-Q tRNA(Asp) synthetase [Cocleimonas flava]